MKSLKLNSLTADRLSNDELKLIKGGQRSCGCGCHYRYNGGSSVSGNGRANYGTSSGGAMSVGYTWTTCAQVYTEGDNGEPQPFW